MSWQWPSSRSTQVQVLFALKSKWLWSTHRYQWCRHRPISLRSRQHEEVNILWRATNKYFAETISLENDEVRTAAGTEESAQPTTNPAQLMSMSRYWRTTRSWRRRYGRSRKLYDICARGSKPNRFLSKLSKVNSRLRRPDHIRCSQRWQVCTPVRTILLQWSSSRGKPLH